MLVKLEAVLSFLSNKKTFSYCYFLLLLLVPLFFWNKAPTIFELPKVWLFNRGIELLWILLFLSKRNLNAISQKNLLVIMCFLSWVIITSVLGENLSKSFYGNFYRSDGLITLLHLVSFAILTALIWENRWAEILVKITAFSLIATSAISILKLLSFEQTGGSFGQANYLAGYTLIGSAIVLETLRNSKIKKLHFVALTASFIAIIFSQSRAAITLFLLLIFLYLAIKQKPSIRSIVAVTIFSLVLYFGYFTTNAIRVSNLEFPETKVGVMIESRTRIYTKGFLGFLERPFVGWGWSNFDHAFNANSWPAAIGKDVYVDKAHSLFLEILITAGFTGLLLFVTLLLVTLKNLNNANKGVFMVPLAVYTVYSQTNITSIATDMFFWMFVGVSLVKTSKARVSLATNKSRN